MPTESELQAMLAIPAESLSVEYKDWLDLSDIAGRANLAKAAIAIANQGGGIIVMGMRENVGNGAALQSTARPEAIGRYSQDDVNAAVRRFAEPEFHCGLAFAKHPETGQEHAFVMVPGGQTVPVMSKRGCEGVINAQRCYVRKPGPRSEEPFTGEEWRAVMQRCLQAGRETMLDAIRVIVQGHGNTSPAPEVGNALETYANTARARWESLIAGLPTDDDRRMPHGHYEIAFEFAGVESSGSLAELRRRTEVADQIKLTGWGPFITLHRDDLVPRPVDGNIETWLGNPETERMFRDCAHCDFWRAHPSGLFFALRGYDEDASERFTPGKSFEITLPVWRVGETLLYAARLGRQFGGDDTDVLILCRYTGLQGRKLDSHSWTYSVRGEICADDGAELRTQATARQIDDNLVEVLHKLLAPLYERFAFHELTLEFVRGEVERLRRRR